jgi:alpha-tubulin suppressor-like RCC1 family protein
MALRFDGSVWCWGNNTYGQLGDGTNTDRSTGVLAAGLTNVSSIWAGSTHSLALKADGTLWA